MNKHAYTLLSAEQTGPFLLSCEHASNHLPTSILPSQRDQHFLEMHWGMDIGAAAVTQHLAEWMSCPAILARYSRLWIDLNRSLDRTDLVRSETEGHLLSFNQHLSPQDIQERIQSVYNPFHQAFDQLVQSRLQHAAPFILLSIHSFTPVWDGVLRTMDMGVLYDECDELGGALVHALTEQGFFVEHNQPYTGKSGLMYSVAEKGLRYNLPHLELEINQFLVSTPQRQFQVAKKIQRALETLTGFTE